MTPTRPNRWREWSGIITLLAVLQGLVATWRGSIPAAVVAVVTVQVALIAELRAHQ